MARTTLDLAQGGESKSSTARAKLRAGVPSLQGADTAGRKGALSGTRGRDLRGADGRRHDAERSRRQRRATAERAAHRHAGAGAPHRMIYDDATDSELATPDPRASRGPDSKTPWGRLRIAHCPCLPLGAGRLATRATDRAGIIPEHLLKNSRSAAPLDRIRELWPGPTQRNNRSWLAGSGRHRVRQPRGYRAAHSPSAATAAK